MRLWALCAVAVTVGAAAADDPKPRYEVRKDHDPDGIGKFYMGREIAMVMGFQAAGWLERPERDKEEEPAKLLKALDLKPGMVVADVGAGSGFHTFRMAPVVGDKGKVLAVDVQPEMLKIVRDRAKKDRVTNVEAVQGTEKDPKLPPAGVDLILMVDVYHEFEFPYEMTEKMVAALKPGGRIVFVEFRAEDRDVLIKPVHKMSERQVIKEMGEFPELTHAKTIGTLPWQHVIVFTKKQADYPQAALTTDHLRATVYLPDADKGFYRSTRFDWSGVVGHVRFAGHTLFGPWKSGHNPANNDDIVGPVEEFGMQKPLGYDEAKAGGTFVKIGVGELVKPQEEAYRFYHNYKIAKAGTWAVKQVNPAKVEFRQELAANGYGYDYTKTVTADPKKAELVIGHALTNTGTKPIVTDVYNHNFFNVDADPVGPNYALDFGFPLAADGKERFAEVVKLTGREWRFTKPLTTGSFHAVLKDLPKEHPGGPLVTLRHGPSKVRVAVHGSQTPARFNVWGMATTVCPEPFLELTVKPGETVRWTWGYEFASE